MKRAIAPTLSLAALLAPQLAHATTGSQPASHGLASRLAGPSAAMAATPANNGFALAMVILGLMVLALLYTIVMIVRVQGGAEIGLGPSWAQALIPFLAVLGMGVASYLTFVETQNVAAVCGPVGDCNSVQASPYARLFGVFPVGLLGLLGYIAILVAWIVGRGAGGPGSGRLADLAYLAMLGMALFGVLFSVYLTYLELWVILAVCIWCLTSAVLITLLMLLSLRPALAALAVSWEDEEALEGES